MPHDYKHLVRYLLTNSQARERERERAQREIKFKCLRTAQITREACLIYVQLATIKSPLRQAEQFVCVRRCQEMLHNVFAYLWYLSHWRDVNKA